jgi:hypothetical protein
MLALMLLMLPVPVTPSLGTAAADSCGGTFGNGLSNVQVQHGYDAAATSPPGLPVGPPLLVLNHTTGCAEGAFMSHFWLTGRPESSDFLLVKYFRDGEREPSFQFQPRSLLGSSFGSDNNAFAAGAKFGKGPRTQLHARAMHAPRKQSSREAIRGCAFLIPRWCEGRVVAPLQDTLPPLYGRDRRVASERQHARWASLPIRPRR